MASENASLTTNTTKKIEIEIERQHSYTTLARLIGAADSKPGSPATPCGAVEMNKMVERLEEIDIESRDLLKTLFSMLENDNRLEKCVRRQYLEDPKVSHMWDLVEQIMATHRGHVDVDAILNNVDGTVNYDDDEVREVKMEDEIKLERFKIRTFVSDELVIVEDP